MTLEIYPVVLQLVRRLAPYLPALRARRGPLGDQLERALISIPFESRRRRLQSREESAGSLSVGVRFGSRGAGLPRDRRGARLGTGAGAGDRGSVSPGDWHARAVGGPSAMT